MRQAVGFPVAMLAVLLMWPDTKAEAAIFRGSVVAADETPAAGAEVWAVNF